MRLSLLHDGFNQIDSLLPSMPLALRLLLWAAAAALLGLVLARLVRGRASAGKGRARKRKSPPLGKRGIAAVVVLLLPGLLILPGLHARYTREVKPLPSVVASDWSACPEPVPTLDRVAWMPAGNADWDAGTRCWRIIPPPAGATLTLINRDRDVLIELRSPFRAGSLQRGKELDSATPFNRLALRAPPTPSAAESKPTLDAWSGPVYLMMWLLLCGLGWRLVMRR